MPREERLKPGGGGPGRDPGEAPRHAVRSSVPPRLLQYFYDVLYCLVLLLGSPYVVFKMCTSRRWRAGLGERIGAVAPRTGDRPCLWIHGVSVGEVLAARTLVERIGAAMPGWEIVVSTTTRTGHEVAVRTFPDLRVFYYPLDFSFSTERVLGAIRPNAVILLELEIWPNFLLSTSRRGIPVFLVNGRITERSLRGYRKLLRFIPEPMDRIRLYAVQTPAYRDRFLALGVPPERVFVTGTMKFDTVETEDADRIREGFAADLRLGAGAWVLVAGSTHEGEDGAVLAAFRAVAERDPGARLVLAPRHPERVPAVEEAVRRAGLEPVRRTRLGAPGSPGADGRTVVVLDTMGELRSLYGVGDVVFVGGSLVPHGGQNVMEPAGLARPVLTGPHTWNFQEVVEVLEASGGLEVVRDAAALQEAVLRLHADRAGAARRGRAAREAVLGGKGATGRTLDLLRERLEPGGAPGAGV